MGFGLLHSWGGWLEASAALVFGIWFVACLVLAFRAIRRDDVPQHRRWMIRAFAVGIGIGTIRIWVGIFTPIVIGYILKATGNDWDLALVFLFAHSIVAMVAYGFIAGELKRVVLRTA